MISSLHRPEQFITPLETYNSKRKYETSHGNEINAVKRMRTVHPQSAEHHVNSTDNLLTPPQTPIVARARTLQPPKPNLIISNPVQFEQYSLAHHIQDSGGDQPVVRRGSDNKLFRLQEVHLEDHFQTIYEKSVELVRRWKEGGFYMEVFYCSSCQLPFENLDRLKEHIDFMHANQEKTEECMCRGCGEVVSSSRGCGEVVLTDVNFQEAREKHELMCAMVRPHKCEICNKTFIFEKRLRNHSKTCGHHDLPCRVCSRTFQDEHKLKYHMVLHAFV